MSKYTRRGRLGPALHRHVKAALTAPLSLDDRVRFSCNVSGTCCGTDVMINPHDVWRIVTAGPTVAERTGIRLTTDLFDPEAPYFDVYLGERSRLPLATIRHRRRPELGDQTACPWLTGVGDILPVRGLLPRLTRDGKPMRACGIHEVRPTICRSYPFGRVWDLATKGNRFIDFRDSCSKCCADVESGPETTLRDFFVDCGALDGFEESTRWFDVHDQLLTIQSESVRLFVGLLAYNFDCGHVAAALAPDEVAARRPPTFAEHVGRIAKIAEAVASGDDPAFVERVGSYGIPSPIASDILAEPGKQK